MKFSILSFSVGDSMETRSMQYSRHWLRAFSQST